MKDKLLTMMKTPVWKNSLLGGVIFSAAYNLFFSDHSFTFLTLVSIVVATAIGATISYFLEKRYSLSAKLQKLLEKYPYLRTGTFQVSTIIALAFGAMIVNGIAFSETKISEEVKQFADSTWRWGTMVMIFAMFAEMLMVGFKSSDIFTPLKSLFKRLIMLSMIIALVRFGGDGVIQTMSTDPMLLAQGLTMLLCILFAFKLVEGRPQVAQAYDVQPGIAVAAGTFLPLLTERDEKHIRSHEAGHALIHALLTNLPEDLMASVKPKEDGSLGRVTTADGYDHLKTPEALEWIMFRNIAGFVAEDVAHDNQTSGSADDLRKWESTARHYLANGFGGFYYQSPTSDLEVKSNTALLQELKDYQIEKVRLFLTENKALLDELSEELGQKEVMDKSELSPFLERANLGNMTKVNFTFSIE